MRSVLAGVLVILSPFVWGQQPEQAPPAGADGAMAADADLPRRAGPLGLRFDPSGGGLRVAEVVGQGVADLGGVRAGDVILTMGGEPVRTRDELSANLRGRRGGEPLPITLLRDGQEVQVLLMLSAATETVPGSSVRYGSVRVPAGYRLRTIVTVPENSPRAQDGRHPAFLYVQGIVCQSIDRPTLPGAADTRLVHALAEAGYVTLRVDKPGLGDSEGPPCGELDFQTELAGFTAALRQLAAMPEVDPDRIYVFGHSMGGVIAPFLTAEVPVRGTVVYGTLARTWFEYQLENVRRQAALNPAASEADITDAVLAEARLSATVLIDKRTVGDAWNRWPELRVPDQGTMLDENHIATRGMAFFHQLQDLNLARAWQESSGAVLAIHGEYDWVTSGQDHDKIAQIVNDRSPGAGTSIVLARADHGFTTHDSFDDSVARMGQGEFAASLPARVIQWAESVERGQGEPRSASAATGPREVTPGTGWAQLPTEPYAGKQDDIVFVNERVGWYGNGAGKVYKTVDGGDSWEQVWHNPGTFVRCLAFVDEQVGVLGNIGPGYFPGVTDATPVYRTEDGGATWSAVSSIAGPPVVGLCALEVVSVPFVNAGQLEHRPRIVGVGRVGGPAAYIWSDDLGKTWQQAPLPTPASMAFDVHFVDHRHGFIASASSADVAVANALILATDDGGLTWREVYRSPRPYELTWKLAFPSESVGYCTIQSYNPDPAASERFVAKTVDGGRTWTEVPLLDDHRFRQFGIAFLDNDIGWVGAMPHGFATTDGGATWARADFGNAVNKIRVVRSPSGVTAYAIGTQVHRLRLPVPPAP